MFDDLLDQFGRIPSSRKIEDLTIFQICGFPHYENVVSNVIAFFLDGENSHRFGTLVLESLLEAACFDYSEVELQFEVERERMTESGRFIDIFLKSEALNIAIENKIFAPLYNDLNDYASYSKNGCKRFQGIVLSVFGTVPNHADFVSVTYQQLFDVIKRRLGYSLGSHNPKHLSFLLDLMQNIENLSRPQNAMNEQFLELVINRFADVERFGTELKSLHDYLRRIVNEVNGGVTERIGDIENHQRPWRQLPSLFDVAVSDFTIASGEGIAIDAVVSPQSWRFEIFIRRAVPTPIDLARFCRELGFKGEIDSRGRFVLDEKPPFETNSQVISSKIADLIKRLKGIPTETTEG